MKILVGAFTILTVLLVTLFSSSGFAKKVDPTGVWNYTLSDSSVKGMCPMGGDGSGSLSITDQGNGKYSIKYVKGMTCKPAKVCVLPGTCSGSECNFSTTVAVDSEGGKVTNTAKLSFKGGHALGSGKSEYVHPAMKCSWTYLLMLTK